MKTTNVFSRNITAYNNKKSLIVNQGGEGSSKTISILQLLYLIAKHKKKPRTITIVSYALPHLKTGAMRDFDNILIQEGINIDKVKNKTDHIYSINNSKIEFFGIEGNEAKAHGPRRDILYINEANRKIKWEIADHLLSRTHECKFIDFNPSREFWFHDKIIPNFDYELIKSTYLDNPYLPEGELQNILMKKDKPGFENWWKVYGEGELGFLEDAILTNWRYGKFNDSLPYGYGLDLGSKHPDAMTKVAVDRKEKKIYVKEEIYKTGLSTEQLLNLIQSKNIGDKLIVADSSAPRTIQDLKSKGKLNIIPVKKGEIIDDIKMLWEYEIIVDPDSHNLARELNNWLWLDKKGEIPMDELDDLIDSFRYYSRMIIKPGLTRKGHRLL